MENLANEITKEKLEETISFYKMNTMFRLTKLIQIVTEQLEDELAKNGIPARVAARVKKPASLRDKIWKWRDDPAKKEKFSYPEAILRNIGDLAAVRVMTYTENDRPKVADLVKKIFKSPEAIKDFGTENKEEHPRVAKNNQNHYRATHMQICLLDKGLSETDKDTLTKDACELQITSMLAHVWNEIEHDTIYKTKTGDLSPEEIQAIHSLGLLTQTGDNIIQSLLSSRDIREKKESYDAQIKNERFSDENELSSFLMEHFGAKVANQSIDFKIGNLELLKALHELDWDHPNEVRTHFSPNILIAAKKHATQIQRAQTKAKQSRSNYRQGTCDLFLLALCVIDVSQAKRAFQHLHGSNREAIILKAFSTL
jgi:ppGpp synthetase/RelA/SpoT-type nucleotidyltranferase